MKIPSSHPELLRCVDDLDLDLHEGLQEALRLLCCGKKLDGIPHIRATIETFMGPPPRTIPQVCKLNAPMMLRQIIARVEREPDDSLLKLPGYRRWQFDRGMENATDAGHLEMVKTLAWSFPEYKVSRGAVERALFRARLEILQWLYTFRLNSDIEVDATVVTQAVEGGSLEIVKWAYTRCVCKDGLGEAVDVAVGTGRSNILKWLLEYVDTSVDISLAACPGQFHMIEWVLENYPEKCVGAKSVAKNAVRYGKLELGRLLFEHECLVSADVAWESMRGRKEIRK